MKLEPISVGFRFSSALPRSGDEWSHILGQFLLVIAAGCESSGKDVVVGHIKGLALLSGDEYLRASVVGSAFPAECEASSTVVLSEISASVNVIVYGLESAVLEKIVTDEAASFSRISGTIVKVEEIAPKIRHEHDGDHENDADRIGSTD